MYYVYVLKCVNNDLYIGYSNNLKERLNNHTKGNVKSTQKLRPIILVYYEAFRNKKDATKRERQLKNHRAKEDLKSQIYNSIID